MSVVNGLRASLGVVVLMALAWPTPAWAQPVNVGAGPLTATLADTEPTTNVISLGRVKVAPGVVVHELGWDSNVFDESVDPKEDYVLSLTPDASTFALLRFAKISAYGGLDLKYFQKYTDERSIGHQVRGRVDFLLSRLMPFVAAGQTMGRERPNGEIDVRADHREEELTGGLAFQLGPHQVVYASAGQFSTEFKDAFEEGVSLGDSLNRHSYQYSAGFRTDLTPLLSVTLFGAQRDDRFDTEPLRNSSTVSGSATLSFDPEAVVAGSATINYTDFDPVDRLIEPYQGVDGSVALTLRILEMGRLSATGVRGIEYSFDPGEAYYLENTLELSYTQRLFGASDFQARGGRSIFDYGAHQGSPPRQDTLNTWGASFGYNLANRTRISLNYENVERRSPVFAERNYDRRRVYLEWTLGY